MSNVELNVVTRGSVSGGVKNEVISTLKDCYKHFGSKTPYRIEILITDTEAIMRDFLRQEKFNMGIIDDGNNDEVCLYDTVRGFPRITISSEKLSQFNKQARQGIIRHQAAHSVLHGSLEYRIFKIPDECRQIAMVKNIDNLTLETAIHKLSLAVKDCEASRLLVDHDYINCQLAFAMEWIQPSPDAMQPQKQARVDRQAKFINQIVMLKPILFAHPLISLPKSRKISLELQVMLGRRIEELVEGLQESEQVKLLQVSSQIADSLTEDTHSNVDNALRHAMGLA
jgi:hypothetical protein